MPLSGNIVGRIDLLVGGICSGANNVEVWQLARASAFGYVPRAAEARIQRFDAATGSRMATYSRTPFRKHEGVLDAEPLQHFLHGGRSHLRSTHLFACRPLVDQVTPVLDR